MSFYLFKRPEGAPPIAPPVPPPAGITHGDQLVITDVGPWALQGVAKGSESLDVVPVPGRGFWMMDTPSEWAPTGTYVLSNAASNKGGIVPVGGLTIDGFAVPAGTVVCQFRDLSGTDFSAQGQGGSYLFRGCRFRQRGVGDPSQFNDFTATYTNRLHYCDMGGLSAADADADAPFWKAIGGQNHRVLRCYMTYQKVALQPNTPNFAIIENYIDKITFFWGPVGPPGGGGPNHTAAIGCEGGGNGFRFQRNRIFVPSPDDAGRVIENGATVAMEGTNGQTYTDCQITDNYVAGANYSFLLFGERAGQTNLVFTGNKVTTQFWTNSGISGPVQAGPFPVPWGSNGNVQSNNTWADDYGTGGNGTGTPLGSRQFPAGNGPRKGTVFL